MGKAFSVLALFMVGETLAIPFAPLLALPLIPLMKPLTSSRTAERLLAVVFIPSAAVTAAAASYRMAKFVASASLPNTPFWLVATITLAVSLFLAAGGPEGVRKWAAFALPLTLGFIALAALLLFGKFQYDGLAVPRMWERNPVLLACEGLTLLGLMPAMRYKVKPFRAYGIALIAALGAGAAVWALGSLTLGAELFESVPYPFYTALRVAKGGEIIGRVEALLIPVSLCVTVLKAAACMTVIRHGAQAYRKD
ncbi:MAG: GerAB/ArcD/ProY family transporter [Oscillospiraceae bacterium]|jgi:hypothetical protein|nr:GerAB/ArcD/ProY family transporter [Oscillospiraceae bacterium]